VRDGSLIRLVYALFLLVSPPWIKKLQDLLNQNLKFLGVVLTRSLGTQLSPTLVASGTVGTVWQRWF
jgi:hypothetical protein